MSILKRHRFSVKDQGIKEHFSSVTRTFTESVCRCTKTHANNGVSMTRLEDNTVCINTLSTVFHITMWKY